MSIKLTRPHLILQTEGGVIHRAVCDVPLDVTVLDLDTEGVERNQIIRFDGEEVYHSNVPVDLDSVEVERVLRVVERKARR